MSEQEGLWLCHNRRFRTNTEKGHAHAPYSNTRGSVFQEPLIESNGYTLWLEHVIEHESEDDDFYWLMWYDESGRCTIRASGVLTRDGLAKVAELLGKPFE